MRLDPEALGAFPLTQPLLAQLQLNRTRGVNRDVDSHRSWYKTSGRLSEQEGSRFAQISFVKITQIVDHTYEEIRAAVLDILAGREKTPPYEPTQFENLSIGAAEVFARRERPVAEHKSSRQGLSSNDSDAFLEVFWDLFREGIITLGLNNSNREFPHCRVSRLGKKLIENQDTYFFHDVSTYSEQLQKEIPSIHSVTLLYLQEALQSFRAGCILSSSVMLGVAAEHTFELLLDAVRHSPKAARFSSVDKERSLLPKINKFKTLLDQMQGDLSPDIKEDLDTHFAGIISIIRTFRNQSGHPTGKIIDREQAYVLLNLFGR